LASYYSQLYVVVTFVNGGEKLGPQVDVTDATATADDPDGHEHAPVAVFTRKQAAYGGPLEVQADLYRYPPLPLL
jgi:hypothetical protein